MRFESLVEIVAAMHLSYEISDQFKQRGGLMFVAPPGQLKTTAIEMVEIFPHARVVSNLTVKTLSTMRQDFLSGQIKTMAFSDFENIYRRHSSVANQIEGVLMGLVDEGFRSPAFSDQRVTVMPARCAIIGGMTVKAYEDRISTWKDTGFARRFLWAKYYAHNRVMKQLERAIIDWKRDNLVNGFSMRIPTGPIKVNMSEEQSKKILLHLRFQEDMRTPFIVAKKIVSVLLWKFSKDEGKAWKIWDDFAPALGKDGTELTLEHL